MLKVTETVYTDKNKKWKIVVTGKKVDLLDGCGDPEFSFTQKQFKDFIDFLVEVQNEAE